MQTLERVNAQSYVASLLRNNIPDPNPDREAINWIFPDFPLIFELSKSVNNFPRISVTKMSSSSQGDVGMNSTETLDTVNLLINVWVFKNHLLPAAEFGETHVFSEGKTDYPLNTVPVSTISRVVSDSQYTFINKEDYILIDSNNSGWFDTLRFIDNTPADEEEFLVEYERRLSNEDLSEYIAQQVHEYLRDNWRQDLSPVLFNYRRAGATTRTELSGKVMRTELQIELQGINIGD